MIYEGMPRFSNLWVYLKKQESRWWALLLCILIGLAGQ